MSLSQPQIKNPATRYLRWSGGEEKGGVLTYWDKEAEEEKTVDLPFSFIVLDELNTITGFSEADHSGYWSNEVRNITKDVLTVRTGSGVKGRGTYKSAEIESLKSTGAKYAKSIYIAFKDETGELAIGNFKASGAALTEWIEFNKKYDISKCAVSLTGSDGPKKKGSIKYFVPIFEGQEMSTETLEAAKKLDQELQQYLRSALSYTDDEPVSDGDDKWVDIPVEEEEPKAVEEKTEEKAEEKPAKKTVVADDTDISNVPF